MHGVQRATDPVRLWLAAASIDRFCPLELGAPFPTVDAFVSSAHYRGGELTRRQNPALSFE
jgi:hypothetical protein